MRGILRKLRGAFGTAVTWAIGWAVGAFALVGAGILIRGDPGLFWDVVTPITLMAGLSGLVGGVVFSVALGTIHSRRRLGDLSPLRMALWGAGAGLLVPMSLLGLATGAGLQLELQGILVLAGIVGGFGAATGGGMVKLAQMADREVRGGADKDLLGPGQ